MNILRYAFLHLRRNVKTALITLVSFLVALIVIVVWMFRYAKKH